MSRKNKGAALFELLHRDKGKATTPDGSLKLPSWFKAKVQPPPLVAPDDPDTLDEPAEPVAGPQPRLDDASGSQPTRLEVDPAEDPAAAAPQISRPVASRPPVATTPKLVPPWAAGPWLQVAYGRVRLNVTQFAAYIGLGAVACALLIAFALGRATVRPRVIERPVDNQQAGEVKEALDRAPDSRITDVGRGQQPVSDSASRSNTVTSGAGGSSSADRRTPPGQALPAGNYYVYVLSGGNKDICDKICQHLINSGFDATVASVQGRNHTVRTKVGTDKTTAERLSREILAAMIQLKKDQPSLLRGHNLDDPSFQPYAQPH